MFWKVKRRLKNSTHKECSTGLKDSLVRVFSYCFGSKFKNWLQPRTWISERNLFPWIGLFLLFNSSYLLHEVRQRLYLVVVNLFQLKCPSINFEAIEVGCSWILLGKQNICPNCLIFSKYWLRGMKICYRGKLSMFVLTTAAESTRLSIKFQCLL